MIMFPGLNQEALVLFSGSCKDAAGPPSDFGSRAGVPQISGTSGVGLNCAWAAFFTRQQTPQRKATSFEYKECQNS